MKTLTPQANPAAGTVEQPPTPDGQTLTVKQAFVTSDSTATELTGSSPATTHRFHFRLTRYCRGNPRCFGRSDSSIWPGSPAGLAGHGPRPGDNPGVAEGRVRPGGRQPP